MKIEGKQKLQKIKRFIFELKIKPNIEPFLTIEDIPKFGIYDYVYVNKYYLFISNIEKKIKDSKYDLFSELVADLKNMFQSIQDYAFIDDPLQQTCEEFKHQVDLFAERFNEEFKDTVIRVPELPPKPAIEKSKPKQIVAEPPREVPHSLSQRLQMLFLLRANQNNQPYLRSIGSLYGIGQEQGDQYVLNVDAKNIRWRQMLSKQQR